MRDHCQALPAKPLISVLMPVYNPVPAWLEAAIESVLRQLYPNWQLCIADDGSTDTGVRQVLDRYKSLDPRITVAFRERNGHISAASNTALELARGEWIALLDHDDLLADDALFWVADAINRVPDAGIVYSDEDKITEEGIRRDPYFKCDWNYELFLSQNMISHLGAYRRSVVVAAGGFREGFEGSQDYDLALRCVERMRASQIVHVPRVLYHWRVHAASTAKSGDTKPYALLAGERALNEHLARRGMAAKAMLQPRGYYRVRFPIPAPAPMASIIIDACTDARVMRRCLESISTRTEYPNYEVLLSATNPRQEACARATAASAGALRLRVVGDDSRLGSSAARNFAASQALGDYLVFLDSGIEAISGDWLGEMLSQAAQPGVGAVGARLLSSKGTVDHAGMILGVGGIAGYSHRGFPDDHAGYFGRAVLTQGLSAVSGACLAIRKSVYQSVGGLDEKQLPFMFSDVDLCMRLTEAGYRTVYAAHAEMRHHDLAGDREDQLSPDHSSAARYMARRWGESLNSDSAYNPNLTLEHEDFSYAWPPRVPPLSATEQL